MGVEGAPLRINWGLNMLDVFRGGVWEDGGGGWVVWLNATLLMCDSCSITSRTPSCRDM